MQGEKGAEKIEAVTSGITSGVDELCQCGFTHDTIHNTGFQCFDESPTAVTFRAEIMALPTANISQLLGYIEQWVATQPSILVVDSILSIDSSCTVAIDNLNDPECNETTSTTTDSPNTTDTTDSTDTTTSLIGGIVGGIVAMLIAGAAFVLVIAVSVKKYRKKRSYNVEEDFYE